MEKVNLSYYKTHTQNKGTLVLLENVLFSIEQPAQEVKDIILELRKTQNKDLKSKLPAVTFGGTFEARTKETLLDASGLMILDFDKFESEDILLQERMKLQQNPFVYCVFVSPSGNGLKVLIKIPKSTAEEYTRRYNSIYKYLDKTYLDKSGKDIVRLCYLSYDEDIFINEDAVIYEGIEELPAIPKQAILTPIYTTKSSVIDNAVNMVNNAVDGEKHNELLKAAFLIGGAAASNEIDEIDGYDALYNTIKNKNPQDLKAAEITIKKGIAAGREKPLQPTEIKAIQRKAKNRSEEPTNPQIVISDWLKNDVKLQSNEITKKIEFCKDGDVLTEAKIKTLFLEARLVSPKITKDIFDCILTGHNPHIVPIYNPFKQYIDRNKGIETNNELERLIQSISSSTPNYEIWVRKWFLGLFAAAVDGKPVRSVLALLGGQNTGKTEFFRRLLPAELQHYYGESKLDREKDDELLMCEKLILNDDESSGKSRQDEKRFKELTSKDKFSLRVPYGRFNEDFKRLAVLCMTSNDLQVISDATGNTRILGVEVQGIDFTLYNSIDKAKLFIDGYNEFVKDRNAYQLTKDEIKTLTADTSFSTIAIEEELLLRFIRIPLEEEAADYLSATEIREFIEYQTTLNYHHKTGEFIGYKTGTKITNITKFGIFMKKHLGNAISKRVNGNPMKVYKIERLGKKDIEETEEDVMF